MPGLDITRKKGERFIIILPNSDEIIVTIGGQHPDYPRQTMVNIDAPNSIKVYREEVYLDIMEKRAARSNDEALDNIGNI